MKTKIYQKLLPIILFVFTVSLSYGQAFNELKETLNKYDKTIQNNNAFIKSSQISTDGKVIKKTFQIEVNEGGTYYLNVLVLGAKRTNTLSDVSVYLDDNVNSIGKLNITKSGWQNSFLGSVKDSAKEQSVFLANGSHTITFTTLIPESPGIDFIEFNKQPSSNFVAKTSGNISKAISYLEKLKASKLPDNYLVLKESGQIEALEKANEKKRIESNLRVIDNPLGEYEHDIDANYTHTFSTLIYLQQGNQARYETWISTSDPVMYLVNLENPTAYSWSDDDSGEGFESIINIKVPRSGWYQLMIRSYHSNSLGTTQLWEADNVLYDQVPLGGAKFTLTAKGGTVNHFTAKVSGGEPEMWMSATSTGKGVVSFGYEGLGDFDWGNNCRIKSSAKLTYAFVFASYLFNPQGIADMYFNVPFSNAYQSFPNLKADDALRTSFESSAYNCYSWSGGRVDLGRFFAPYSPYDASYNLNNWYNSNPNVAFDNYFGNNPSRYAGAKNYTRADANVSNAEVALWYNAYTGYTHGSVTKPANDMPHGYDWESKPGGLMRTMHPKDALVDYNYNGYGAIRDYYRFTGTYSTGRSLGYLTLEESIKAGLTVIDTALLTEGENEKLISLIEKIPNTILNTFNSKYDTWKATWTRKDLIIHNIPKPFISTEEYNDFYAYCKYIGKAIVPLLISKVEQGEELARVPLAELTIKEFGKLMVTVREESNKRSIASNARKGEAYIAPSLKANWTRYNKKLLGQLDDSMIKDHSPCQGDISKSTLCGNFPNPFSKSTQITFGIPSKGKVYLKVFNVQGKEVISLSPMSTLDKGWHTIEWNGKDKNGVNVEPGIYTYKLIINGTVHNGKLIKE